jgi:hypothetical protein
MLYDIWQQGSLSHLLQRHTIHKWRKLYNAQARCFARVNRIYLRECPRDTAINNNSLSNLVTNSLVVGLLPEG